MSTGLGLKIYIYIYIWIVTIFMIFQIGLAYYLIYLREKEND